MDGEDQGPGEHPRAAGPILGQIHGAEVGTEGEALGEVFFRAVVEVGVAVDLDLGEHRYELHDQISETIRRIQVK